MIFENLDYYFFPEKMMMMISFFFWKMNEAGSNAPSLEMDD